MENLPANNGPEIVPFHPEIEQGLRDGHSLHGFRSGGGLRVVYMENDKHETVAYGEAPHIEEALQHAALDYSLGHETYEQQYSGEQARYPHYLTGDTEASSLLDEKMRGGMKIEARRDPRNNDIAVALSGMKHAPEIPAGLEDFVTSTGNPTTFEERGIVYGARRIYSASGDVGMEIHVLANPHNRRTNFYDYAKIAAGPTFVEAVAAAFEAPEVELMEEDI